MQQQHVRPQPRPKKGAPGNKAHTPMSEHSGSRQALEAALEDMDDAYAAWEAAEAAAADVTTAAGLRRAVARYRAKFRLRTTLVRVYATWRGR